MKEMRVLIDEIEDGINLGFPPTKIKIERYQNLLAELKDYLKMHDVFKDDEDKNYSHIWLNDEQWLEISQTFFEMAAKYILRFFETNDLVIKERKAKEAQWILDTNWVSWRKETYEDEDD